MPGWYSTGTLYKGLFFLVVILLALEYLFGSITETKHFFVFNATRIPHQEKVVQHSPLVSTLHLKKATKSPPLFNITELPSTNNSVESVESETINATALPPCPDVTNSLRGRIEVLKAPVPSVQELEGRFSWLRPGGHWAPDTCKVPKSVALIIPFRCRGEHLLLFLQHMHPFLKRQQLDYTIYIVEQDGDGPFNRAMLMNIGFKEALKMRNYDCFIFHDIDLLPEDDRNLYTCPPGQPRHMSVAVDIFKYRLPYPAIFGGVSAINREHFELLNGFSNSFWGWGGEDDDMSNRIRYHNLYISRYPLTIARYTMLTHKKDKPSPNRYDMLKQGPKRFDKDGLNSLDYKLIQSKKNLLYTWVLVGIEPPR
ncbi:beta-1,4-galactosyltransferase 4 isoform X2 [Tribolium castaneum]|uniref:Beta-1,4-N-acetylgalactosaminyltransferase n=1 Tax=Tribolium castaneum TaxID=7070 RepID=D6WWI8_TRICA|nr:PREDICTED: beta-1,4-galactosyltransferase 4 isoform X2 [Tribolium castaneum]EFA08717.1 Beta-1,4-N-acetylgalactosaminyltransferase bre-4-like Protein [Tribolium castaneum]|eukprot:XP_974484.1 PREDICTED: beta-1,4-galactosyltransferase 4 isoform X2 [Tribolium castaneum]